MEGTVFLNKTFIRQNLVCNTLCAHLGICLRKVNYNNNDFELDDRYEPIGVVILLRVPLGGAKGQCTMYISIYTCCLQ